MNHKFTACIGSFGCGMGLMYFYDPVQGRRRRKVLRDRTLSSFRELSVSCGKACEDVQNRLYGVVAEVAGMFRRRLPDDAVLEQRVRSALGRAVSHPRAIEVRGGDGWITRRGNVFVDEARKLIAAVRSVRGVRDVIDELEKHKHR